MLKRLLVGLATAACFGALLPVISTAQCYQCYAEGVGHDPDSGRCQQISNEFGYYSCENRAHGGCDMGPGGCIWFELAEEEMASEDGTLVHGKRISDDAFSVRTCLGHEHSVYTPEGEAERKRAAERISFK